MGRIRARAAPWYRSSQQPLLIGSSVGFLSDVFSMAGTLGCFVRTRSSGALYILSNNHVLADENRYKRDAVKVNLRGPLPTGVSLPEKVDSVSLCVEIVGVISKRR